MATERRLIDANALMKAIKSFRWFGVPNTLQLMFDYLKIIIRDQPTVDAVEVVHGRCKWCDGEYHTKIMATAIRYHSSGNMNGYELPVNYCPNCGAKMDGDGNVANE